MTDRVCSPWRLRRSMIALPSHQGSRPNRSCSACHSGDVTATPALWRYGRCNVQLARRRSKPAYVGGVRAVDQKHLPTCARARTLRFEAHCVPGRSPGRRVIAIEPRSLCTVAAVSSRVCQGSGGSCVAAPACPARATWPLRITCSVESGESSMRVQAFAVCKSMQSHW